jgi:hypothetical protein
MVVILSPDSAQSRFVRSEWTYLLDSPDHEPDLITLLFRECEVPFGLHCYQRIMFSQGYENETTKVSHNAANTYASIMLGPKSSRPLPPTVQSVNNPEQNTQPRHAYHWTQAWVTLMNVLACQA